MADGHLSDRECSHFRQVHLKLGSWGIALWRQLSHCNQPSARIIIGRNSFPSLQYWHRMTESAPFSISFL
jgi:hypothetical protein